MQSLNNNLHSQITFSSQKENLKHNNENKQDEKENINQENISFKSKELEAKKLPETFPDCNIPCLPSTEIYNEINLILREIKYQEEVNNHLNSEEFGIQENSNLKKETKFLNFLKSKLKLIFLKFEKLQDFNPKNQTFLDTVKFSLEKKIFSEIFTFYLKKNLEKNAIDFYFLKDITEFSDYEDTIFIFAEYLTKNSNNKIEFIFELLQVSTNKFIFSLYPLFSVVIRKLMKNNFIQEAIILINYMNFHKIEISSCALCITLEILGKLNRIDEAEKIFNDIQNSSSIHIFPIQENIIFHKLNLTAGISLISYGILIKILCKDNQIKSAFQYYESLKSNFLIKDEIIFNLLIDGCSKSFNLDLIKYIYDDMLKLNIIPSIVTYNSIIDSYVRAKDLRSAWKIFQEDLIDLGIKPDNFTYSILFRGIRNSTHKEYLEKALKILDDLSNSNQNIDIILINVLIDSCIFLKDEKNLVKIFDKIIEGYYKNLKSDIVTFNTFLKGCAQMNLFEKAYSSFNKLMEMNQITPNDVTFNTMIDACVRGDRISLVWGIVEKMQLYGINPDNFTYSTIIKGINMKSNLNSQNNANNNIYESNFKKNSDDAELELAFKLFENVKKKSKPDEILYNCIMDACLRFGQIEKMMEFHNEMLIVKIYFIKFFF